MMLMSYGFDSNNCYFKFKRCLFEYKGREFMLYPGNMRECDSFDTLVLNDEDADKAFELLHEFLYLFGWANQCAFHFVGGAGIGTADYALMMRRTGPAYRCPRGFWNSQVHMLLMADPKCSEDFIKAISLYNDAQYNNDIFYRFFTLFKILDLPVNGLKRDPAVWINANLQCFSPNQFTDKVLHSGQNLGLFLQDGCRNAIAHIHRKDISKSSVISYSSKDYEKISIACSILMPFVRWFIEKEIRISQTVAINVISQDNLPMVRSREIEKLGRIIFDLKNYRVDKVSALQQDGAMLPKIVWKIDGYIYATLDRALNLGTICCELWGKEESTAAILLARSVMETVANIYIFYRDLKKIVLEGVPLNEIDDFCMQYSFASRDIPGLPTAVNIMTQLKNIEKDIPHFKDIYDSLSEVCHPNYWGVIRGYGKLDKENRTLILDAKKGVASEMMDSYLPAALGSLSMIIEMVDEYLREIRPLLIIKCT